VHLEKKTHPEPLSFVIGGSSPKCAPHRKTLAMEPALQKPVKPFDANRLARQFLGHRVQNSIAAYYIKMI
jgi:hypothetical protein